MHNKEFVNKQQKGMKKVAEGTKQKEHGVSGKVRKKGGTTFASSAPAEREQCARECDDTNCYLLEVFQEGKS